MAISKSYDILKDQKYPWVVEIDFKSFFNTVPHKALMAILKKRINDKRLLMLIWKLIKANVVTFAGNRATNVGTPQGSIVSPILSNIYLNEALDQWFKTEYSGKQAQMVRYADDAIFMFASEEDAKEYMQRLEKRMSFYQLTLNQEKTKLVDFRRSEHQTFSFLGFKFFWGKRILKRRSSLRVQTDKKKLLKKSDEIKSWIKRQRNRIKISSILKITAAKLRGHYNFYGYKDNRAKLNYFYWLTIQHLYKWLNRRSQKKSYNWKQFLDLIDRRLPRPPEIYKLKPLGVKYARSY